MNFNAVTDYLQGLQNRIVEALNWSMAKISCTTPGNDRKAEAVPVACWRKATYWSAVALISRM